MARRSSLAVAIPFLLIVTLGALSSCARFHRGQAVKADKVAYGIIEETQETALGEAAEFTIDPVQEEALDRLLAESGRIDWNADTYTTPSYQLSLSDTLAIAFAKSRDYQTRKEQLFLDALSLSDTRWDYGFIFGGSGEAEITRADSGDRTDANDGVETFGSGGFTLGVRKKLITGANVSVSFTKSFVHYLTGTPQEDGSDSLSFKVVQPLLNGAGPLVAWEGLRQNERNMIYSVRTFKRYQQGFVIEIATIYYQLLEQLDRLGNEYTNYKTAILDLKKADMMTEAGRMSRLQLDQTRQRLLEAENRLNNAQASFLGTLDRFKLTLGLPLDVDIGPDRSELESIRETGLVLPDLDLDQAIEIALDNRLDLLTAADRTSDSLRKVKVAANDFLPNVDARYEFNTSNNHDNDTDTRLDFAKNRNTFGLDLILPLDWTPRRNQYRRSLVAMEQTRRRYEEARDSIIVEVREGWRQLERSRKNYEIQLVSVELARRRVESAILFLESGRASTRDLLEAQDALVQSKNSLTEALVNYTIRRLEFWNSIERFKIDSKGMWYE